MCLCIIFTWWYNIRCETFILKYPTHRRETILRKRTKRKVDERETEGNRKQIRGMSDPIPLSVLCIPQRAETIIMLKPPSALTVNATESSTIHITLMVIFFAVFFFFVVAFKLVKFAELSF